MDDKSKVWLADTFFEAFRGNQKEIYSRLQYRYVLEWTGKTYTEVWNSLRKSYGEEKLAEIVALDVQDRLTPDDLSTLRRLFWADELPTFEAISRIDRNNWRCWVDTTSGLIDAQWITTVVQWSRFADLYFQYLDPLKPHKERIFPSPKTGAFTQALQDPAPLFARWLEWNRARVFKNSGIPPNLVVGVSRNKAYVLKHWDSNDSLTNLKSKDFVNECVDAFNNLKSQFEISERKAILIACSLAGFDEDARSFAKASNVELWTKPDILTNWMRAGAIGIAFDDGNWYIVGLPADRPRAHMTPKRRVRYN